ncbi:MupG family TIM beta-alpha barrel fold protein [Curtobacterium sp. BRB10]|uniref:MupG family TIM beta-alpha barrel fold protein n=1 Tax=Curtobacterium sp. BRB10 TaxID=2962579 RepID=UPI0037BFABFF
MGRVGVVLGRGPRCCHSLLRLARRAFIAGHSVRRGPLGERLSTVEEHRTTPPSLQAVALVDTGGDDLYIGCSALTDYS